MCAERSSANYANDRVPRRSCQAKPPSLPPPRPEATSTYLPASQGVQRALGTRSAKSIKALHTLRQLRFNCRELNSSKKKVKKKNKAKITSSRQFIHIGYTFCIVYVFYNNFNCQVSKRGTQLDVFYFPCISIKSLIILSVCEYILINLHILQSIYFSIVSI